MSSTKKRRAGGPPKYPPEFRRDAVAMVLDEDPRSAGPAVVDLPSDTC